MGIVVPDDGRRTAKLVLVGEAPGEKEEEWGRPFVGPSGYKLEGWWARYGLSRQDFYITNVHAERPPHNRIEALSRADLEASVEALHERLALLDDPWLIVPTGNIALRALMRVPLWGVLAPKISNWRGSVLGYMDNNKRLVKCIPTYHPAYLFREPGAERACLHDWRRISKDVQFRELRVPVREHRIAPNIVDLEEFADYIESADPDDGWLAFDIETTQRFGNHITCIGFALSPHRSFVVPTTDSYWRGLAELSYVWELVAKILRSKLPKVTQNGHYDYYWLGQTEGLKPVRWHWDTLAMHHCLDATDEHSLGYLASCYSRQPYWKTMTKDGEGPAIFGSDERTLWTYNGIDCCVTLELAQRFHRMLVKRGQLDFYIKHYREMAVPALRMMRHGIRVDDARRRWWHFNLQAERIEIQDTLEAMAGEALHGKVSLSVVKLKRFFYDQDKGLGLPVQYGPRIRGKRVVTTGEVAVRKLIQWTFSAGARAYKRITLDQVREIMQLILDEREKDKLMSFLAPDKVDADGRMRATFKLTTETGRFASAANPMRTGLNLQNQHRGIRHTFVPDE